MEIKLSVPHAIIVAGLIIAGAILLTGNNISISKGQPLQNAENRQVAAAGGNEAVTVEEVGPNDHVQGNPKADIAVIEFSDFECPFCKSFHPTMKRLMQEKGDEVMWVYRHFPLDMLHKKARNEAEASECAAEQGGNDAFWKFANRIFEITPANDGLDPAQLPKIAGEIGLNVAKFAACLSSGTYKSAVEANLADGKKAGVTGTPASVIVNVKTGKTAMLIGAETYENLLAAIERVK